MTNEEVSSLLIMDGERSLPVGIITDKDLRKRVLAVVDVQTKSLSIPS